MLLLVLVVVVVVGVVGGGNCCCCCWSLVWALIRMMPLRIFTPLFAVDVAVAGCSLLWFCSGRVPVTHGCQVPQSGEFAIESKGHERDTVAHSCQ